MQTQNGVLKKDDNGYPVMGGTSSADNATIINSAFNPATRRLLTDSGSSAATAATWGGSGGNTSTITDARITPTSMIVFMTATPPNGLWGVVCGTGSAVITSSDSESAALAFTYKVFA